MSATVTATDPRAGLAGPEVTETSAAELDQLLRNAVVAARDPALAHGAQRARMLRDAATRLRAAGEEIVALAQEEAGLPPARLQGELERTCGQLEMFATAIEAGDHLEVIIDPPDPDAQPIPRPDLRRMLVPLGPVAVFGASNLPLAFSTAGGDTATRSRQGTRSASGSSTTTGSRPSPSPDPREAGSHSAPGPPPGRGRPRCSRRWAASTR